MSVELKVKCENEDAMFAFVKSLDAIDKQVKLSRVMDDILKRSGKGIHDPQVLIGDDEVTVTLTTQDPGTVIFYDGDETEGTFKWVNWTDLKNKQIYLSMNDQHQLQANERNTETNVDKGLLLLVSLEQGVQHIQHYLQKQIQAEAAQKAEANKEERDTTMKVSKSKRAKAKSKSKPQTAKA